MLSVIPKHKGTDKLQGDIKHRIAKLKGAVESERRRKGPSFRVKPEGSGQIMLVGPPNSGKSALLAALTRARPEIADYPCTTREPIPGMMEYEKVQIQLVDLPPVWKEHCESFVFDNIKACDGVLVVVDVAAADPARDLQDTLALLQKKHVQLVPARLEEAQPEMEYGAIESILLLNKADLDTEGKMVSLARESLDNSLPVRVISAVENTGLDELAADIFTILHVIRVFTKQPGKQPDAKAPFTVPVGSTVLELAGQVHHDFAENFRSARVWGSAKFDGQIVQRDHVLRDLDVVELTMQ